MDLHRPGFDYAQPHAALAGRRVLVTGGRGTLGQALCEGFASLGCEVCSRVGGAAWCREYVHMSAVRLRDARECATGRER